MSDRPDEVEVGDDVLAIAAGGVTGSNYPVHSNTINFGNMTINISHS
jgi:hypothetical protein